MQLLCYCHKNYLNIVNSLYLWISVHLNEGLWFLFMGIFFNCITATIRHRIDTVNDTYNWSCSLKLISRTNQIIDSETHWMSLKPIYVLSLLLFHFCQFALLHLFMNDKGKKERKNANVIQSSRDAILFEILPDDESVWLTPIESSARKRAPKLLSSDSTIRLSIWMSAGFSFFVCVCHTRMSVQFLAFGSISSILRPILFKKPSSSNPALYGIVAFGYLSK